MTGKIFRSTLLIAALILFATLGLLMAILYRHFTQLRTDQLREELSLAVTATEQYGNAFLENVGTECSRLTWIGKDGTVLIDTWVDEADLSNHADREEFIEAIHSGQGYSVRNSSTLTQVTIYQAQRLSDGTVLRISGSQQSAGGLLANLMLPILSVALAAMILCAILSGRMASRIVEPINRLDLERPLSNRTYEEITPLLRRINQQHLQIEAQLESLRQRSDEFEQITSHMKEGLVLLNREGRILSLNPTAAHLLDADSSCIGRHFLAVATGQPMRDALNAALDQGWGTTHIRLGEREFQFDLSRIESEGDVIGAVVLAFDVTESLAAEQSRREFSANVSHELKTPLQSIIGSAELLESGLVKPEDTGRFVGHIRRESARLLQLVEDIIRLSQLDEGANLPTEAVDLCELSRQVLAQLEDRAAAADVEMLLEAPQALEIYGVPGLLQEILFNLCDNAIKYNRPGGKVWLRLERQPGRVLLQVKDNGIGIPQDHQSRIFERFYRVDKSHSRSSGGTGLGLSIVKHAAGIHGARIDLESRPGQGTCLSVYFPVTDKGSL